MITLESSCIEILLSDVIYFVHFSEAILTGAIVNKVVKSGQF